MNEKDIDWCFRCGGIANDESASEDEKCICPDFNMEPKEPPWGWSKESSEA